MLCFVLDEILWNETTPTVSWKLKWCVTNATGFDWLLSKKVTARIIPVDALEMGTISLYHNTEGVHACFASHFDFE